MIEAFAIHEVTLPGGARIGICRMPGRSGDLPGDVGLIDDWGAGLVLSMTTESEMSAKGAAGLSEALHVRGIEWRHFPVMDYGAPDGFETRWPDLSGELHALLEKGGRILTHCMGGCGRSGMAAMRLLCERGVPPEEALALVRAARPCAVERDPQREWAAAGYRG